MKVFLALMITILVCCNARELSFKSSGIKATQLDSEFLKELLDFEGIFTDDLVHKIVEAGVVKIFKESSYGYDREMIAAIVNEAVKNFEGKFTTEAIEESLKKIHFRIDELRNETFEQLIKIYGITDVTENAEVDKEIWNYVSQYPEKFGFTYSHYHVVKLANEILDKEDNSSNQGKKE